MSAQPCRVPYTSSSTGWSGNVRLRTVSAHQPCRRPTPRWRARSGGNTRAAKRRTVPVAPGAQGAAPMAHRGHQVREQARLANRASTTSQARQEHGSPGQDGQGAAVGHLVVDEADRAEQQVVAGHRVDGAVDVLGRRG